MHSRIYQVIEAPLPIEERMTSGDIPEWFCNSVADYVDDIEESERAEDMEWFCAAFHGDCDINAETGEITFSADAKKHYFEQKYQEYREILGKLQAVSFEEFAGIVSGTGTERNVHMLGDIYAKEYGFYIVDNEESEVITLDAWVRHTDLTKTHFLGGIVDYHF